MNKLTATKSSVTLCSKSVTQVTEILMLSMGRFQTRNNNGVGDYTLCRSLFLCPKSLLSTFKNPTLWWRRLLEQFRYTASETNMNFHRPKRQTFSGGLSLNNGASQMHNHTQKLTLTVSETKKQSLQKQVEIINHAISVFCMNANGNNRNSLKNDALELVRMLDDLPSAKSRSRFNVLNKSKQLVAEGIPFDQARQYQDCIVKFSGMEVSA